MITRRNIAAAIIFSIITCGIYGIYWFIKLTDEVNYVTGNNDTSGGVAFLLGIVTCGIYYIYWAYRMGEKIDAHARTNSSRGILYLLLSLCGLSIVVNVLIQDYLNRC